MTCIVGVATPEGVWIGGDSAASDYHTVSARNDAKVFENGPCVMGFTTSFRMGQLLRYALDVPPRDAADWDVDRWMSTQFVDAVRDCLKTGGWAQANNNEEKGGTFLVGYAGRLFVVYSDYQVAQQADGLAAIGSGGEVALGALHARRDLSPQDRIIRALEVAEHCTPFVRRPCQVVEQRLAI